MRHFTVLDSWRGICALLVAVYHIQLNTLGHLSDFAFMHHSWLFVDFFFVLSGFVIGHAYGDRLADAGDVRRFLIRRFGRLWPLHVTMLAVLVAIELARLVLEARLGQVYDNRPFTGTKEAPAILTNLFLVHALGLHDRLTWNKPSWSISTEFWTYLVFALACWLAGRRRLPVVALALAGIGAAVVAVFSPIYLHAMWDFGIFRCIYGFFVGYLVQLLVTRAGPLGATSAVGGTAAELAVVALVVGYVSLTGDEPLSMVAPLVFGLAIWVFAAEAGAVSRLLRAGPFRRLGAWSYSIYLVHAVLILLLTYAAKAADKLLGMSLHVSAMVEGEARMVIYPGNLWLTDGFVVLYALVVLAVAGVTFRLIEEPGRRFFNRLAAAEGARMTVGAGIGEPTRAGSKA